LPWIRYSAAAHLNRWLDKKDLFTMKPAVSVVILFCLVSFGFAEERYLKPPQELVEIGKTHGCKPVEFDLTKWPGGVDPPFLYGIAPGEKSDSVAFWCEKVPKSYPPYILIVVVRLPDHEWSKCPQEIHSINPAKGLSLSPRSSLDGFVYLDNPKVNPPHGEYMKYTAIKSEYDGAGEIIYCYKGRWVVKTFH
jgi:hypothetical protein